MYKVIGQGMERNAVAVFGASGLAGVLLHLPQGGQKVNVWNEADVQLEVARRCALISTSRFRAS